MTPDTTFFSDDGSKIFCHKRYHCMCDGTVLRTVIHKLMSNEMIQFEARLEQFALKRKSGSAKSKQRRVLPEDVSDQLIK